MQYYQMRLGISFLQWVLLVVEILASYRSEEGLRPQQPGLAYGHGAFCLTPKSNFKGTARHSCRFEAVGFHLLALTMGSAILVGA